MVASLRFSEAEAGINGEAVPPNIVAYVRLENAYLRHNAHYDRDKNIKHDEMQGDEAHN